jgi:hypothetical protein
VWNQCLSHYLLKYISGSTARSLLPGHSQPPGASARSSTADVVMRLMRQELGDAWGVSNETGPLVGKTSPYLRVGNRVGPRRSTFLIRSTPERLLGDIYALAGVMQMHRDPSWHLTRLKISPEDIRRKYLFHTTFLDCIRHGSPKCSAGRWLSSRQFIAIILGHRSAPWVEGNIFKSMAD